MGAAVQTAVLRAIFSTLGTGRSTTGGCMISMALALAVISMPLAAFAQEILTIKTEAGPATCADFH
jgi:hypothetical protein